jgi:hypothetical protein
MSAASLPDRRTVGLVALEATWTVAAQPDVSSGSLVQQPLPRQPVAASSAFFQLFSEEGFGVRAA